MAVMSFSFPPFVILSIIASLIYMCHFLTLVLGVNDIFKTISIPSASLYNSLMEGFLVPLYPTNQIHQSEHPFFSQFDQ